jgi:hypothetical protein
VVTDIAASRWREKEAVVSFGTEGEGKGEVNALLLLLLRNLPQRRLKAFRLPPENPLQLPVHYGRLPLPDGLPRRRPFRSVVLLVSVRRRENLLPLHARLRSVLLDADLLNLDIRETVDGGDSVDRLGESENSRAGKEDGAVLVLFLAAREAEEDLRRCFAEFFARCPGDSGGGTVVRDADD